AALFAAGNERPYVEAVSLAQVHQPGELSRRRQVRGPHVGPRARPAVVLLKALDLPLDVEAPDLLPRLEAEALEGNRDFGRPSLRGDARPRVPDAVPVVDQILRVV